MRSWVVLRVFWMRLWGCSVMTIADRLVEIREAKANIKNAIQNELGADLSSVPFVDYHQYIKSSGGGGGYYAPSLNITFEEKEEYVVGEAVTFSGVTKTLDGSTVLTGVPVTYEGSVVATSDSNGAWSYTTTWVSGGCEFSVVDSTYGVVCRELVYPCEKFYDSFTNLQAKVNALATGETLVLDCNYRYLETTADGTGVSINTAGITIDGQGKYALDGNLLSRIIHNNADNTYLKGIKFVNGKNMKEVEDWSTVTEDDYYKYGFGGAVFSWNPKNLKVSDSTFTDCSAQSGGGAIINSGEGFTVSDSTFTGCSSAQSGGGGGAIWNYGEGFTVSDSTFTDCSAQSGGGAIWNSGEGFTVSDSTFTNNGTNIITSRQTAYATNCYWGTNNPTSLTDSLTNVTVENYSNITIATGTRQYMYPYLPVVKVIAKHTKDSTILNRRSTINSPVKITVGDTVINTRLKGGYLMQTYTEPSKPYTVSVEVAGGEAVTTAVEDTTTTS